MIRNMIAVMAAAAMLTAAPASPAVPDADLELIPGLIEEVEIVETEAETVMCEQIVEALGCTQSQAKDILVGLRVLKIEKISDLSVEQQEDESFYLHFVSGEQQYKVELSKTFKFERIADAEGKSLFVVLY